MKNVLYIFIVASTVVIQMACHATANSGCHWDAMPNSLGLKIVKTNVVVSDTVLINCKLSYYDNGTKKYMSDFSISSNISQQKKGLIATRAIGLLSADDNIKTYYLEYPNGWAADTLFVGFSPRSPATNCLYALNAVKVNGINAPIDSSFRFELPVFVISKP